MKESSLNQNYSRFKKYSLDIRRFAGRNVVQQSVTVVLSLFLISFFVAFALRPTFSKIAELRTTITASEETLEKLEQKTAALSRASSLWEQARTFSSALDTSMPIGPFYRTYIKEVETLVLRHNLGYISSTYDDALIYSQVLDPYGLERNLRAIPLKFTFRLRGNYASIRAFLEDFRSIDRVAEVENVGIVRDVQTGLGGGQGLVLSVSGNVYYFADTAQIEKAIGVKK